jgi:hypothetical protein
MNYLPPLHASWEKKLLSSSAALLLSSAPNFRGFLASHNVDGTGSRNDFIKRREVIYLTTEKLPEDFFTVKKYRQLPVFWIIQL